MDLLNVKNLKVMYKENGINKTVCHMSFQVKRREMVGIVGASGSGKSSGMLALLGLLPAEAIVSCEQIKLGGEDLTPPQEGNDRRAWHAYEQRMQNIRGRRIAMVFQDPFAYLNPLVKIEKQIVETIRSHKKCSFGQAREYAAELLNMAGIRDPYDRMKLYPFEMSGGMRQRVVIAMALACEPDLIIADEPTTALDATVQRQILDLLQTISKKTGTSVLLVSHDMGVIASICDRVLVMQEGRIVEQGGANQIFYEPEHPYTHMLVEKAKEVMGVAPKKQAKEPVLYANHVSRVFRENKGFKKSGYLEAVYRATFEIRRGETFGLVGESGCGKTTLAKILTGTLEPTEGNMQMDGKIQMVFQDPYASFDPRFSVENILKEPLLLQKRIPKEEFDNQIDEMLFRIGLHPEDRRKKSYEFSGGQRQRIAIARALLMRPDLLVCDEPIASLDVSAQVQILELLKRIQEETDVAYLFISHDLNVVKRISHRMAVMYLGTIVEMGDTQAIYEDPWHPYTKQLLSAVLVPDPRKTRRRKRILLKEDNVAGGESYDGCPFAGQCGYAFERCRKEKPDSYHFSNREVRCFLYSEEHTRNRREGSPMISQI